MEGVVAAEEDAAAEEAAPRLADGGDADEDCGVVRRDAGEDLGEYVVSQFRRRAALRLLRRRRRRIHGARAARARPRRRVGFWPFGWRRARGGDEDEGEPRTRHRVVFILVSWVWGPDVSGTFEA